jgi:hypothetical protein
MWYFLFTSLKFFFHIWIANCASVTEEYQDGENSYCEFFGLVPFLQLAIHLRQCLFCRKNCCATLRLYPTILTYFDVFFYILKKRYRYCVPVRTTAKSVGLEYETYGLHGARSWKVRTYWAGQTTPYLYEAWRFSAVLRRDRHYRPTLSRVSWTKATPSYPISVRFTYVSHVVFPLEG